MLDPELVSHLDRRFTEWAAHITAQTAAQTAAQIAALDQSLRTHIDDRIREVRVLIEDNDSKIRLVAEGLIATRESLTDKIQMVAEGVIATQESLTAFRAEVAREFEEVKAINRLSYRELERRLSALES
jgi:hypothetical protein